MSSYRRLELGLGVGIGFLAMTYATPIGCDGACHLGGVGWLVSFAARYLLLDGPRFTVGAGLRAITPVTTPAGEGFGFIGRGTIVLGVMEVGFGRSR